MTLVAVARRVPDTQAVVVMGCDNPRLAALSPVLSIFTQKPDIIDYRSQPIDIIGFLYETSQGHISYVSRPNFR
jgi:hypothetical protein